ncbi:unnamed protein product [Staurois parvus]|uniref:Uncharacterized protein n=1 Tax=Staurois parvus TaxID=386267 RepID=A0ABN9EVE0_9NEOB|nr:unnamed protein product [Staurois parvus]
MQCRDSMRCMPWVRRRSYTVVLPSIRRNNLRNRELYCPDPLSSFWETRKWHMARRVAVEAAVFGRHTQD